MNPLDTKVYPKVLIIFTERERERERERESMVEVQS